MKIKRLLAVVSVLTLTSFVILSGCTNENPPQGGSYIGGNQEVTSDTQIHQTTISQPQVNTESFPRDYTKIEAKVYTAAASMQRTIDGKKTGSNMIKILSKCNGVVTDKVKKEVEKEIKNCIKEQVPEVTCTGAELTVSEENSSICYIKLSYIYNETGAEDINIFSVSLGEK